MGHGLIHGWMRCCAGHLDAAGEWGLEREAETCRAALSARQAAAVSALQAAAQQAEALTFSDALRCATDVSQQPGNLLHTWLGLRAFTLISCGKVGAPQTATWK